MRFRVNQLRRRFKLFFTPKAILALLTLFQLIAEWLFREVGHIMSFWETFRWDTCVLFLAALALWHSKWWSYLIAVPLTARIAYKLSNHVLGSPLYIERDAEGMLEFFKMQLEYHPEYVIHIVLAVIICCYAAFCLLRLMFRGKRAMP